MLRRRAKSVAVLVAALLGLAGLQQSSNAAPPRGGPAASTTMSRASARAVVSGDARFEVLSPTLIRTEYAGDSQFLDAPTFNAIGRDGFSRTHFTTRTSHGWLTIDTGAVVLRYKTGSGPFGPDNLQMRLKIGRQQVTAAPWGSHACDFGKLCEAESLQLDGVSVATDHTGYTGAGFAAGFQSTGSSISFQITVPTAGTYQLDTRYANAVGGDGKDTTRTLTVSADGGAGHTLTMPTTADWNTWALADVPLDLAAGTNTVTVKRGSGDSGNVNIDSLAVLDPGAAYPPAPSNAKPCAYGTVCEAEAGTLGGSAVLASDHNDYSGGGFVAGLETAGAQDTLHVTGVPRAGRYALQLRYANAQSAPRKVTVKVGSGAARTVSLPPTSSWDSWRIVSVPVDLGAGDQDVTLGCTADADSCHLNLDTAAVASANAPLLAPHAPLGGYRRGLDGVNGSAPTTPGLLYQDGWSLLNDSGSAVFDNATKKVTPRSDHHGKPYQDGYLFAYGHDYQRALSELATLTGPSELLPRWAYGVWYSEYYDRTAADYENKILPKFRADGVPLDVLVTDTDFKSPSTWDGWEMDRTKFPDPKAFFDWAASMGLHNTLNIHPSIVPNDPQFAQAEATAGNTLTKDGSQYIFDWGNPAQLKAYMDLHQSMERAGADFWWLDWCCDNSYSSLRGVTPDAWINQQYATDANKTVGRGFVLSRAYGSLQAGGYSGPQPVAGGPWADKRTTVHFTGDTTSDWATLKFEVGYTPGESASTGLSAVSHDIGGFNNDGTQAKGAEPGSTKEADDLYARWVQLGTFQPIDRLHGNHSDRLPWQYGTAAKNSAEKFLNLRENLVPYTYTLAEEATRTGVPVTRPLYLQYPNSQEAYAQDDSEYLYGPDMLVAPVTTPGQSATTSVWFPPGSSWTDYFTGKTYAGGTTAQVTTDLSTMPVFIKSGGIVTTRSHDVTNDVQNKLTAVTATVAEGASGSGFLYEDDGVSKTPTRVRRTRLDYSRRGAEHILRISRAAGPVMQRQWTVAFTDASAPRVVTLNGRPLPSSAWTWDAAARTLTVTAPSRPTDRGLTVAYR